MSFGIGDSNKKPGIFDSFRAAMAPPALPPDDGEPIKPPTTVLAAMALSILAGLVFVFIGGASLATTNEQVDRAVTAYNQAIADCTTQFGGIGSAVVVPEGAAAEVLTSADGCKTYQTLTDETISGARTQNIMISATILIIGLVSVVGGFFLRQGKRWSRFMLIGAVVLSVLITMLFQVSNIFTLGATLLLIVAVMLCYIGKGGIFFARIRARRAG